MVFTDMISQRSGGSKSASGVQLGTGRGTLRLRSKGPATVEQLVSPSYLCECSSELHVPKAACRHLFTPAVRIRGKGHREG